MITIKVRRPGTLHRRKVLSRSLNTFRWVFLWHGLFYGALVVVASVTLWQESFLWDDAALFIVLAFLLGGWYGICLVTDSLYWQRSPLLTQGYLAIGWGLWFVLLQFHWLSWFLLFGLCSQLYMLSSKLWKLPGLLILTTLMSWQLMKKDSLCQALKIHQ